MPPPEQHPRYYADLAKLGAYVAYVETFQGKEVGAELYAQIGRMAAGNEIPEGYWHWPGRAPYEDYEADSHAGLLEAYDEKYAGPIAELREHLAGPDAPKPFAESAIVKVHLIEVDGKKYAVRFIDPQLEETEDFKPISRGAHVLDYAVNIHEARGKSPLLEQMAGMSYEDGATVSEFIESVPLTVDVIERIPDEHLDGLFETAELMTALGLEPDAMKTSNMPYNPQKGIHVIDFFKKGPNSLDMPLGNTIGDLAACLVDPTNDQLEEMPLAPDEYQARVRLLDRFIQRCRIRYGETDPVTAGRVERILTNFKNGGLKEAADRWHAQQPGTRTAQTIQGVERHTGIVPMAEVFQALEAARAIVARISRGLAVGEKTTYDTMWTLRTVLNGSETQLAEEIIRDAAVAWDHLQQALLLVQQGGQALDIAVQDYRGHPL